MTDKKNRPTIVELEKMLDEPGGKEIEILPNGSIKGMPATTMEGLVKENRQLREQVELFRAKVELLEKIRKLLR